MTLGPGESAAPRRSDSSIPAAESNHRRSEDLAPACTIENLWHAVCDTYPGIEVASRHALDEYELRPEDVATLAAISDLRDTYLRCVAIPGRADEDAYLLADIDQRLSSLEGRIAILRLATA